MQQSFVFGKHDARKLLILKIILTSTAEQTKHILNFVGCVPSAIIRFSANDLRTTGTYKQHISERACVMQQKKYKRKHTAEHRKVAPKLSCLSRFSNYNQWRN